MLSDVIYVEFLTIGSWVKVIVPALRRVVQKNPQLKPCCYIFDGTPATLGLAYAWGRLEGFRVERLHFQMIDVHDKDGMSVFCRVASQDTSEIQALILKNADFQKVIRDLDPATYVQAYLAKTPVYSYDLYGPLKYKELWHVAMMTQIASWHQRQVNGTLPFSLYINHRPWMKELEKYVQNYGGRLNSLGQLRLLRWWWAQYRKKIKRLNWRVLKTLLRHRIFGLKVKYGLAEKKPYFTTDTVRVLTEHYGQLNLDDPQCHSDVFFADGKGIGLKDVLLSFNLTVDPVNKKKYDILRSHNLAAVALTPQSCDVDPSLMEVFRPQEQVRTGILNDPLSGQDSEEIKVLKGALSQYNYLCNYWRQFFQQYNIKLHTTWSNSETNQMAIADSIRDIGGIATVYQRSYEALPWPQLTVGADVIFSFSPTRHTILLKNGSKFRHHVAVGYLGDYRFELARPKAAEIRRSLLEHGAKHIVAYFDENTIDDGRWFLGHQAAQDNYRFWLEKLLADPQLGLILKPKKPYTLRRRLGEVGKLLDQAKKTGRCFIFEEGRLQGSFPPAVAALAADIAVHDSLGAGTAGLESALTGTRTLLMDFEGWLKDPFYKLGPEVVFREWESAWQACLEYFKDPKNRPKLGDWSGMIDKFDPFHDGRAAERMSGYLKELLEGLRHGDRPVDILDRTAESYASRWGKDKVQHGQEE